MKWWTRKLSLTRRIGKPNREQNLKGQEGAGVEAKGVDEVKVKARARIEVKVSRGFLLSFSKDFSFSFSKEASVVPTAFPRQHPQLLEVGELPLFQGPVSPLHLVGFQVIGHGLCTHLIIIIIDEEVAAPPHCMVDLAILTKLLVGGAMKPKLVQHGLFQGLHFLQGGVLPASILIASMFCV